VDASSHSGVEAVVVDTIKGAKLATGNDATGVVSPTGAATTGGWAAYLHCFAMAGTAAPTCTVKLQDSPDGSSWLDVADGAFETLSAANANVPGGQRIRSLVVAGTPPTQATLRKFTRFLWTITGGTPSFTIWAGHVRY
jgi:hypothetical protein